MKTTIRRLFVEKRKGFDIEAQKIYYDLKDNLLIDKLDSVRIINRYDIDGITDNEYNFARNTIFSEPQVDIVYDENINIVSGRIIAIEYFPGQFDQRADSAAECIQILTGREKPKVKVAKLIVLEGNISDEQYNAVKKYLINPVESQEASIDKPLSLGENIFIPQNIKVLDGFINMSESDLHVLISTMGLAMSCEDIAFCQQYFRDEEKRDPTITELKVIDTYWSDHCRHTTFNTKIESVEMDTGTGPLSHFNSKVGQWTCPRVHQTISTDSLSLMSLATLVMKNLKVKGLLDDLDESDEINACSINIDVDVDDHIEKWVLMFKNETHNHPTEIEPFGGAATCLGGAIRDPLSGRSYVYQSMRITGAGDPTAKISDTLPGKLPQKVISTLAASGFSSYGNQIGLATGFVHQIHDNDFIAKRMEVGAVIGAAPKDNIRREKLKEGDIVLLLGGRTGRDGCGGATGSSKQHDETSLYNCGAEVQKGNAPTERKMQRLFRNSEVSKMIKKCNDFGAGGICVAVGELADSIDINLDNILVKYLGIDGTELAISESQERMAVAISNEHEQAFIKAARVENLEATKIAEITSTGRLRMIWRNDIIVDIDRNFLNTNGIRQSTDVIIKIPDIKDSYFSSNTSSDIKDKWVTTLKDLNICSQKGLVEMFDSTIGRGTVLAPFGGIYQLSPSEGMVAKIPVLNGNTNTGSIMTSGYNPMISKWSPFHGAIFAIIEALAKIVAIGGDYKRTRLSFQEYFEKLGKDKTKWGKPFTSLLGAYLVQTKLGIPAIGGKDSMSGTFNDINVPPTLIAFAVNVVDVNKVISTDFKKYNSNVILLRLDRDKDDIPDFDQLDKNYTRVHELINSEKILSSHTVKSGGISEAINKMCFGNKIGFKFMKQYEYASLFSPDYGSLVLEVDSSEDVDELFCDLKYEVIGKTQQDKYITVNNDVKFHIDELINYWEKPLESVFKTKIHVNDTSKAILYTTNTTNYNNDNKYSGNINIAKPRVFIPVFPGTNCEYDMEYAFKKAGGKVNIGVFNNLTAQDISNSIDKMVYEINNSQIIAIPGGFSGGDEPDGSGKMIATVFRNEYVKEAVMKFLKQRDGLIVGICNGFQALIKLGLLPFGEIKELDENSPTLTYNTIGRHVSKMIYTKVTSTMSPWFSNVKLGDIHTIAVSHGEGRFVANRKCLEVMECNGQIATQYVDLDGKATYDIAYNPNGSIWAIEGITSIDGKILGKMGHSERIGNNVVKNIYGNKDQKIFESGIEYFG